MKKEAKLYFRDHFRYSLKTLLIITVIALIITFFVANEDQIGEYREHHWHKDGSVTEIIKPTYSATLGVPVGIFVICIYLVPILEFYIFKKRRNLDCFYALPIDRKIVGLVHYLTGLITVIVPFTLSYGLNALMFLRAPSVYDFQPLIPHYLITLLLGICQYSLFVFVFNRANTIFDGICFIILWTLGIGLVAAAICEVYMIFCRQYTNSDLFLTIGLHTELTTIYAEKIVVGHRVGLPGFPVTIREHLSVEGIYAIILYVFLGILTTIGFIATFGKDRPEKTGENSDSWLGYKLLIPVCSFALMTLFTVTEDPISCIGTEVYAFIGYTIYRRGLHFKKSDIIILILLAIFLFV